MTFQVESMWALASVLTTPLLSNHTRLLLGQAMSSSLQDAIPFAENSPPVLCLTDSSSSVHSPLMGYHPGIGLTGPVHQLKSIPADRP